MNASDTRGKTALDTIIKDALSNKTVAGVMQGFIVNLTVLMSFFNLDKS